MKLTLKSSSQQLKQLVQLLENRDNKGIGRNLPPNKKGLKSLEA